MNLDQIREKFPKSRNLSDDELASLIHKNYFPKVPEVEFYNDLGMKPPTQYGQIGKDALGIIKRTGMGIYEGAKALPELGRSTNRALEQFDENPFRTLRNLGAGAVQGLSEAADIPTNIGNYLESRGVTKRGSNIFPEFGKSTFNEMLGSKNPNDTDKFIQQVGGLIPTLFAAKGLGGGMAGASVAFGAEALAHNQDPFAAALMPQAIKYGAKGLKKGYNQIGELTQKVKGSAEASRNVKPMEERLSELENKYEDLGHGNDLLNQAKAFQEGQAGESRNRLAEKIADTKEAQHEPLSITGRYLEGLTSEGPMEAKAGLANATKDAHEGLLKKESELYEPYNKKGSAAVKEIPEEARLPAKTPKGIEGTSTAKVYESANKKEILFHEFDRSAMAEGKMKQKLERMRAAGKSKTKEYAKAKAEYEAQVKRTKTLSDAYLKAKSPTVYELRDLMQKARNEAYEKTNQMKNGNWTSQELDKLRAERAALEKVQKDAINAIKKAVSPEEWEQLLKANEFHSKMISPFRTDPFLNGLISGEGTLAVSDFHKKASATKHRGLVKTLFENEKIRDAATVHDIPQLKNKLESKDALNQFLKERGKHLNPEVRKVLRDRVQALTVAEDMKALQRKIKSSETALRADSPHIAEILERNPSLKEPFHNAQREATRVKKIEEQMQKLKMSKTEIGIEVSKYKRDLAKLKADAELWENGMKKLKAFGKEGIKVSAYSALVSSGVGSIKEMVGK